MSFQFGVAARYVFNATIEHTFKMLVSKLLLAIFHVHGLPDIKCKRIKCVTFLIWTCVLKDYIHHVNTYPVH